MFPVFLGVFDVFKTSKFFHGNHNYYDLYQDLAYSGASAWTVTFKIGVYAILVAFVVLGINTILNSSTVQQKLQIKSDTKKNIIVSILFFSLVGLITMITKIALDW